MSTIKVNAFQDTSGRGFYPNRVWLNWTMYSSHSIRADGNVSSITDNGTGNTTINFSNSLTDANYAGAGTTQSINNGDSGTLTLHTTNQSTSGPLTTNTSSALRVYANVGRVGNYDMANNHFQIVR